MAPAALLPGVQIRSTSVKMTLSYDGGEAQFSKTVIIAKVC